MGHDTARCGRAGDGDATCGSEPADKPRQRSSRMSYSELGRTRIGLT
jgi:hypothetical protein